MRIRSAHVLVIAAVLSVGTCATTASGGWFFSRSLCDRERNETAAGDDKSCLSCILPGAPPQGEVIMALPARVDLESLRDEVSESESEALDDAARLDQLEEDLTRLTVIVEGLAEQHASTETDMARIATLLEELVRARRAEDENR